MTQTELRRLVRDLDSQIAMKQSMVAMLNEEVSELVEIRSGLNACKKGRGRKERERGN